MRFVARVFLSLLSLALFSADGRADGQCGGHRLLSVPRPEASCAHAAPQIFESPDKAMRALVFPAGTSLDATPDMESRVAIRSSADETLASEDYSSLGGEHGYYVHTAKWSPDSRFFVYSLVSSGGHSPWSFPVKVYSRKRARTASFNAMIDGKPTLSGDFTFTGPHSVTATTWREPGALDGGVPVTADLEDAFGKLPASQH